MHTSSSRFFIPAATLSLILAAIPASAALVNLTSPDGKWSLSSDEYGSYGEAVGGSFARRDFGSGLTGYAWTSGVLVSDGANRQWLTSDTGFGFASVSAIAGANLISDTTVSNVRTSVFNVPGFAGIQATLVQSATNEGLSQRYTLSNTSLATVNLSVISFHDVDLDGSTFTNNTISAAGNSLSVIEGTRTVTFGADALGYAGFLAGHVPGGGVTNSLDAIAYTNFGIPGANLNEFRNVAGAAIGADFDADNNNLSDSPADVGYLLQNNVSIQAGQSVSLNFTSSVVPEPGVASLGLLGALSFLVRRRKR
jgi:hypothetical protein